MNCTFCNNKILSSIVYEDKIVKVFSEENNIFIIPKKHYKNLDDINMSTLVHVNVISKKIYMTLKEQLNIDGITIIQYNGDIQNTKHYYMQLKIYNKTILTPEEIHKTIIDNKNNTNYPKINIEHFLNIVKGVHKHMEEENWNYSIGDNLFSYNIKMSLNNPNKVSCCSTYVATCLYKSGIFSEEEMNSFNYNWAPYIYSFLILNNWIEINNFNDLCSGDIVFESEDDSIDHVQIYSGNGKWFNAGSNSAIKRENPYLIDFEYSKRRFIVALRYPNFN